MRRPIDERFQAFHARRPEVYRQFVRLAFELKGAGVKHGSPAAIIGRIRWDHAVAGTPLGVDNSFSSRYATLAMTQQRELAGFFMQRMWPSRHSKRRRRRREPAGAPSG